MRHYIVAVVNGTKARFLTLKPVDFPGYESGPKLVEQSGMANDAKSLSGEQLWANVKTGRNRGSSGRSHSYDDHRQNHINEFERRFAQEINARIGELAQAENAQCLVLVAEPQILGLLRESLSPEILNQLVVKELTKDLCHLKPHDLQEYLAEKELLPAYQRATNLAP